MTLVFTGWIDPSGNTLDLVCLVAPFKSADLIIEKIPIFGTLMSNRLIAIPVRASGPLNDPLVNLMPVSEIGRGLSKTIENILNLPMDILGGQTRETPENMEQLKDLLKNNREGH